MKRLCTILLAAGMLFGLTGCQDAGQKDVPPILYGTADNQKEAETAVPFRAQYIRTNGSGDGVVLFPCVRIIQSPWELENYYTAFRESFDLERREKVSEDFTIGFLDACDGYDETFFQENYLIFVLLEEGSGSIRHQVSGVERTEDKKLAISIDREVPETGTDDMAQWHIILELSRDVLVTSSVDTYVFVDGLTSVIDDQVICLPLDDRYKSPPAMAVHIPEQTTKVQPSGFDWTYEESGGLSTTTIADQISRPIPAERLQPISIGIQYAEPIYAYVRPGSYSPTDTLGYLVKLDWDISPATVQYACWPVTAGEIGNNKEETVAPYSDRGFYAKAGGYVYEITATWKGSGVGCRGTVNYYVYIVGGGREVTQ